MVAQVVPIDIVIDPSRAERGSRRAEGALRGVGRGADRATRAANRTSASFQRLGATARSTVAPLLQAAAAFGSIALGTQGFNATRQFERGLSQVRALSGATAEQVERVAQAALDIGTNTELTAVQGIQAFGNLALAGVEVEDQLIIINDLVNASIATQTDLDRVAQIVTRTLNAFGLEAFEAARVTDVLTNATANSQTTFDQLGIAYRQSAATARAYGVDLEGLTAIIQTLSDAGLAGEQAGTGARNFLARVTRLGIDVEGREIAAIVEDLRDLNLSQRELQRAFELEGFQTAAILLENVDALRRFEMEADNSAGSARTLAEVIQDDLEGSFQSLRSALSGLGLNLFRSQLDTIRGILDNITGGVRFLAENTEIALDILRALGAFLASTFFLESS